MNPKHAVLSAAIKAGARKFRRGEAKLPPEFKAVGANWSMDFVVEGETPLAHARKMARIEKAIAKLYGSEDVGGCTMTIVRGGRQ